MSSEEPNLVEVVVTAPNDVNISEVVNVVEVDESAPTEVKISTFGLQGPLGPTGPTGPIGETGGLGPIGPTGATGVSIGETAPSTDLLWADTSDSTSVTGIPAGGSTGQVLAKSSGTDYDTEWRSQNVIAEVSISGNTPSVTFTNIPAEWRVLQLVWALRSDRASSSDNLLLAINGNTNNHVRQGLGIYNGSISGFLQGSNRIIGSVPADTGLAGALGYGYATFTNADSSDARKHWNSSFDNRFAVVGSAGWLWSSLAESAAITELALTPEVGTNFTDGRVILLGVR